MRRIDRESAGEEERVITISHYCLALIAEVEERERCVAEPTPSVAVLDSALETRESVRGWRRS